MAIKKKFIICFMLALLVGGFMLSFPVFADDPEPEPEPEPSNVNQIINGQLQDIKQIGLPGKDKTEKDITDLVFNIIRMVLGFLALIFLVLTLVAGFRWMTSAGNEESITKAKKMMASALIGIVIIFLSYAITSFVFMVLLTDDVF